jgi:putative DNA primase/helicase
MAVQKAAHLRAIETADPLGGPVPPAPMMPPGYRWHDDGPMAGLWLDPHPTEEGEKAMRLAGLFKVAAETRDAEGTSWGLLLQWRDPAGRQHEWAMPKAMLAGRKATVWEMLSDGGLFIAASEKARNRLADFLNLCRPNARAIAVDRTGWHDGLFVMPGRAYGANQTELAVYQGAPLPKGLMASRGTLEGWQQEIAAKADGNPRLALCLAAAFVGPIMELADAEGGGLHLRGDTSGGKTTCLKAAASVWGAHSAWVQTWRMTANGVESTAAQHSETLLCLDELRELAPRDAVTVPYMLAHGRAKGRQRAEGGLRRQAQWRVFFLSTGELGLADLAAQAGDKPAGGTDVRMIDIAADAGSGRGVWEA